MVTSTSALQCLCKLLYPMQDQLWVPQLLCASAIEDQSLQADVQTGSFLQTHIYPEQGCAAMQRRWARR